jgi:hypothetical protein
MIVAALVCLGTAHQTIAGSMTWQEHRLLKPTEDQLEAERRGQVMIYDRLDAKFVDEALDANFARIQNMMFIRVQHQTADGNVVEDDDC